MIQYSKVTIDVTVAYDDTVCSERQAQQAILDHALNITGTRAARIHHAVITGGLVDEDGAPSPVERGAHLSAERSLRLAAMLNLPGAYQLPGAFRANRGLGMGYDGVSVGHDKVDGWHAYFDTTYGGDDGYTEGLRTYITLPNGNVDDGWGEGPPLTESDEVLARWIVERTQAAFAKYAAS